MILIESYLRSIKDKLLAPGIFTRFSGGHTENSFQPQILYDLSCGASNSTIL